MEGSEMENSLIIIMLYKVHNDKITYDFLRMECQRIPKALHTQTDSFWSISSKEISELFPEAARAHL